LSPERDGATIVALHLYSQVIGKVPTAVLPWRNHGWHLTLHVTPRGLRTEPIHAEAEAFTLALDLVDHQLLYESPSTRAIAALRPMPVADFHRTVRDMLEQAGHRIRLHGASTTRTAPGASTARCSMPTASSAASARPSSAR
jgi:uncharacterized protein DUF5996